MRAIRLAGGLGLGALLLAAPACNKKAPADHAAPAPPQPATAPAPSPEKKTDVDKLADAIAAGANRGMQLVGPKPPGTPADCRGDHVDLATALAVQACALRRDPAPLLPAGVTFAGPTALTVAAGDTVTIPMQLVNTTAKAVKVDVNATCGAAYRFRAEAFRRVSERTDRADLQPSDRCIAESRACQDDAARITIEPRGRAHIDVRYQTVLRAFDDECQVTKLVGPLPKGHYELEIMSPWTVKGSKGASYVETWTVQLEVI